MVTTVPYLSTQPRRESTQLHESLLLSSPGFVTILRCNTGDHLLLNVSDTSFQEGGIYCCNWDNIRSNHPNPEDIMTEKGRRHASSVVSIQPSPFFEDVLLSAGDWTVNVWKDSVNIPLISSPAANGYVTVAR